MRKRSFFYDINFGTPTKNRVFQINMPFDTAFQAVLDILKKMKTNIIHDIKDSGSIIAYKGWGLISDGEVITVSVTRSETENGCEILVQSESAFAKPFDLGVNDKNLDKFEVLLRALEENADNLS